MSKTYFSKLNYSLANEDTSLEYAMVKKLKPRRTLSVCGSGGRCLPLLAHTQDALVCADLSEQQLLLAKHRLATIEKLSHRDFLLYWGFPPFNEGDNRGIRKEIFEMLPLDAATRAYFTSLFETVDYRGLIYEGKWEKTFTGLPKLLKRIVGDRYDEIFSFTNLDAQKVYFDQELENSRRLLVPRLVLRAVGNASFFNAFLYKGHFIQKNVAESHFEYYRQTFRKLFYQGLTRENYFLQLIFLGRIGYPEANPIEAQSPVFEAMKKGSDKKEVLFHKGDLVDYAANSAEKFDFVSLSDVPSYFSEHTDRVYLQRVAQGLNKKALVVVRCYLRIPENTDLTGYKDVTEKFRPLIEAEKTQMYRTFVYEYQG